VQRAAFRRCRFAADARQQPLRAAGGLILAALASQPATAQERALDMTAEPLWPSEVRRVDPERQFLPRIEGPAPAAAKEDAFPLKLGRGRSLKIHDSTSFTHDGTRYRISGIVAIPAREICRDEHDRKWACGLRARAFLRQLIAKGRIRCRAGSPAGAELLVECRTPESLVAQDIVRSGFALTDADKRFQIEECEARRLKTGIWSGTRPPGQKPLAGSLPNCRPGAF